MKILITGDFVVNQEYDTSKIGDDVIELFKRSDLNIVNLEAPVTNSTSKIIKTGPYLKADRVSTEKALKALNINVVTLANNHILDYDEDGVASTLSFCTENQIRSVGAGMKLRQASETLYINTSEGRIAIVNFAENEWASASHDKAGSNPMDLIDNGMQIRNAKQEADFVFVIIHGGHEYYNLPSPRIQKQYRFYAEQGADIVIGHHTHCISGSENYNGVPIYYSLGNFLFTNNSRYDDWYSGLILEVEIVGRNLYPRIIPVKQETDTFRLQLLIGEENNIILSRITSFNDIITDKRRLTEEWELYVKSKYNVYLSYWSPLSFIKNRYLKAALKRIGIQMLNKTGISLFLNLMRCEAHRDLSKEIAKKYLSK